MPDLDDGKFYTADDMRRARAEGRRQSNLPVDAQPPSSELPQTDASRIWANEEFRHELMIIATKAAQVAVRGRDDAASALGMAHADEVRNLLISEDHALMIIKQAVHDAHVASWASLGFNISTDEARIRLAMQIMRAFDLEENASKILKRIAWQVAIGFIGFVFAGVAAWFGFGISGGGGHPK